MVNVREKVRGLESWKLLSEAVINDVVASVECVECCWSESTSPVKHGKLGRLQTANPASSQLVSGPEFDHFE